MSNNHGNLSHLWDYPFDPASSLMMVDWLTVEVPAELPGPICGGQIAKFTNDGQLEWSAMARMQLEGSFQSSVLVRSVDSRTLEISGNLAKFENGHNLYGTDDPKWLLDSFLSRVAPVLWPGQLRPVMDLDAALISRIDVTSGFLLDRPSDVLAVLKAFEERGHCSHRGRGVMKGEGTLVYGDASGQAAKPWQLTLYSKLLEVMKRRGLPDFMRNDPEVMEWVGRLLRFEVRLRAKELTRIGRRRIGDWSPSDAVRLWSEYVARVEVMDGHVMEATELEGVKPRLLDAYDAWRAGRDLRIGRPRASFYRLRSDMKATFGVDIAMTCPKSNVVPLKARFVSMAPVERPAWANRIDAALAAVRAA